MATTYEGWRKKAELAATDGKRRGNEVNGMEEGKEDVVVKMWAETSLTKRVESIFEVLYS